jgi:hypothetical protein
MPFQLLLLIGLAAVPAAQDSTVVAGSRVRVESPLLGWDWHTGMIVEVGGCFAVQPDARDATGPMHRVPIAAIRRMQVSGLYDGRLGADGRRRHVATGAGTTAEIWRDVSATELERLARCQPGGVDSRPAPGGGVPWATTGSGSGGAASTASRRSDFP